MCQKDKNLTWLSINTVFEEDEESDGYGEDD